MGLYDRDYMRVDRRPAPARISSSAPRRLATATSSTLRAGETGERTLPVCLLALLGLQVAALLIPTVRFGWEGRSYTFLEEFGLPARGIGLPEVFLVLPGLGVAGLVLRALLGAGRLAGAALLALAATVLLWLGDLGGFGSLATAMESSIVVPGGGAVWLLALAVGLSVAGFVATGDGTAGPLARALLVGAAVSAAALVAAPLWNPLGVQPWTAYLGDTWESFAPTERVRVILGRGSDSTPAEIPVWDWVQWLAKLLVCAAQLLLVLGLVALVAVALRAAGDGDDVDAPASIGVGAWALPMVIALVGQAAWFYTLPDGSLGNSLFLALDNLGHALAGAAMASAPFVGLGALIGPRGGASV